MIQASQVNESTKNTHHSEQFTPEDKLSYNLAAISHEEFINRAQQG
tara:strand:+ start:66 stop:203 length:138 start_codon:yes stop_codon:yes gene_type:complete